VRTTLRGDHVLDPPVPTGQVAPQPPPELRHGEGTGGLLMNVVAMRGSKG